MSLRLAGGCLIEAGERIGAGGEGSVHRIKGVADRVVKLYGAPKGQDIERKLRALLALSRSKPDLQRHVALPIDLVFYGANLAGFIMPLAVARGPIDEFIHPVEREGRGMLVSVRDLVVVGLKLTQAAHEIHAAGLVIGDVNESNVLIREDGSSCFLDSDSFQVTTHGEVFTCPVAKELFLPPELQGTQFGVTHRNPNHDAFGIAVLLFQLLMNGRHPFVGVPKDGTECHIHERIRLRDFAYRRDGKSMMKPPPGVADASMLGGLSSLFERAFLSSQRPTMVEWSAALREFGATLKTCSSGNPRHFHLPRLSTCPFCALPRDPYPAHVTPDKEKDQLAKEVAALERDLTDFLGSILSPEIAEFPVEEASLTEFGDMPIAQARALVRRRRGRQIAGVLLAFPIGFIVANGIKDSAPGAIAGIVTALLGLALPMLAGGSPTRAKTALRAASNWATVVSNVQVLLEAARQDLSRLPNPCGELASIPQMASIRQQKFIHLDRSIEGPERAWQAAWRQEKLKSFRLDDARIADIGEERKRILRSHGINVASDLNERAIQSIPGFGPYLTLQLMSWRRHREQEVEQLQPPPIPRDWQKQHEARRKTAYAQILRNDRSALQAMRQRARAYEEQVAAIRMRAERAVLEARTVRQRLQSGILD